MLTAVILLGLAYLATGVAWESGPGLHTGLEVAAGILAAVIGLLALVRYYSRKSLTYLFIAVGFLGAGLFDAFHAVTSNVHFAGAADEPLATVTAWGWFAGRTFLAIMLLASWAASRRDPGEEVSTRTETGLFLIAAGLAFASFLLILVVDLPAAHTDSGPFSRPSDMVPGILFLAAFVVHLHRGAWRYDRFDHWLLFSLTIHAAADLLFMALAPSPYTIRFDLAHALKVVAYTVTLFGLAGSMKTLLGVAERGKSELERLNRQLTREVARRAAAEEELSEQKVQVESVFERMSEGVMLVDTDRKIVRANAAAETILATPLEGAQVDEVLQHLKLYDVDQETRLPPESFVFERALRGEETDGQRTWITLGKDWEGKSIQASGRPLYDEKGTVEGAVVVFHDVTAEAEAREAAMEHQVRLKAIVETAQDAIVSIDEGSKILEFNPAAERLWGYTREEVLGQSMTMLMPERYRDHHRAGVTRYLRTGQPKLIGSTAELVALHRDGHEIPVELSLAAWHTDDDTGFTGIIRNIAERKVAERRLRESEQTYRAMVTEVPDYAIFMLDPSGHIKTWNEGAARITGYAKEEALGRHYETFFPREAREKGIPSKNLERAKEGRVEDHGWRVRKDGTRYYARSVMTTITGPDGELLGFTKITHDQTDEREAEERLRESEERYRLLAENATDLVAVHSLDGVVHYASPAAKGITGYGADTLTGRKIQGFFHADDRRDFERTLQRVSETEESTRATFRFIGADHETIWLEAIIRWMPAATPDGEDRLLATYRDVTVQVQDRDALARSNQELQEFAFIASHDLKEPLRKIIAFGERVETQCAKELGPRGIDYIGRMRSAAERMRILLEDLLAYSRVTTQAQPFTEIDLTQLTEDVVDDLATQIEETDAKIDVQPLPPIQGDATQMRQLLQNLISNALKYHRDDEPPRVAVYAADTNGMVDLVVEDNGIGFDMRYNERIFRPFQRLHGRTEYSGSGMGLAIVRKIAERHGGTVLAESTPGQGSRFTVQLPLNFTPTELEPIRGADAHA